MNDQSALEDSLMDEMNHEQWALERDAIALAQAEDYKCQSSNQQDKASSRLANLQATAKKIKQVLKIERILTMTNMHALKKTKVNKADSWL